MALHLRVAGLRDPLSGSAIEPNARSSGCRSRDHFRPSWLPMSSSRSSDALRAGRLQRCKPLECSIASTTATTTVSDERRDDGGWLQQLTGKGWTDAEGRQDERVLGQFNALAIIASDRMEMHTILANQRDNWNHLFHSTISIAAVSAATVTAMSAQQQAIGLSMVAIILNLACAALMAVVNYQQPSQLAEEQRRAARFFKRLAVEVDATLQIDPRLREHAWAYWDDKVATLHALDDAFPLPLTPNGLAKFPKQVRPSELSVGCLADPHFHDYVDASHTASSTARGSGAAAAPSPTADQQWTPAKEEYLKQVCDRLENRDIPAMIAWAEKAKELNLLLARTSPILAVVSTMIIGTASSVTPLSPPTTLGLIWPWLAASLTVGALFTHSLSHALQLGSFFEVYRNHAGYYADIERAVERVLRLPPHQREDWRVFLLKFNLRLGHDPNKKVVNRNNHTADKLL